jgi:hypothetical protein
MLCQNSIFLLLVFEMEKVIQERECVDGQKYFLLKVEIVFLKFHQGESPVENP